jgi:hypothetical protein
MPSLRHYSTQITKKMKLFYTALIALGLAHSANAQTAYSLDKSYNGTGYRYNETVPTGNENGYYSTIHLNDDGTEYVALKQNVTGYAESIAALIKIKQNATRDSSFANNGVATNNGLQDVRIHNIDFLAGNKIYCSGSGWGGYVWNGSAWSSQTYGGGVVAPYIYSHGGCKLNDTMVVQIGSNGEIVTFKDNGNANQNNYAWIGASGVVDYTVDGVTFTPVFNSIASIPNSHYFTAGVTDTTAFIIKFGAGGFTKDPSWASNGILRIPVADLSGDAFLDMVALPDGKLMAVLLGQPEGTSTPTTYIYRFNANGTPDNTWGTNGVVTQWIVGKIALLPQGEVAMLYSYEFNGFYSVGIIRYSSTGQQLDIADYPLLGINGFNPQIRPIDISANAAGDIAICGSVRDSATNYDKPFTMRLKRTECNIAYDITNATSTSFTGTVSTTTTAVVYIARADMEGFEFTDTITTGSEFSFTGLEENETYYITIRDDNGCELEGQIDLANIEVGINEIKGANVSVYPNPATHVLNLKATTAISQVEIVNILGETVSTENGNVSTINVADLANGLYIARVHATNGQTATVKFTKQ